MVRTTAILLKYSVRTELIVFYVNTLLLRKVEEKNEEEQHRGSCSSLCGREM